MLDSGGAIQGQKFGKYMLIDRIAVGGMAEIFLARQEGIDGFERPAVIKRIRPHLSNQPGFIKMFLNEAKIAAQLNHPNVCQIYDLGRIGDSYFLSMEFIHGRDMSRIIPKAKKKNIPFPMEYALRIAEEVCQGLHHAHSKTDAYGNPLNIVHRDVSPENVQVSFDGHVKMLDFGIAKAQGSLSETKAGEIKGKLSYLSPEQCKGLALDHRSDVFGVGAMLYEWLTGYKLFKGESDLEVINNIIDGKIYPPSYFKASIPEPVERIAMKSLEKDREKRYQSAWEMHQEIEAFLKSHTFYPTNMHLSNFMKQLFKDELEKEQKRYAELTEAARRLGRNSVVDMEAVPDDNSSHQTDTFPARREGSRPGGGSETPQNRQVHLSGTIDGGGGKLLKLAITNAEFDKLKAMAEKNNTKVTELVKDILRHYLKYQ
ncbi:MAG: Serine/threonine-protein kinase PknD [Myxococcota bacterium]|nr:Serine/threonine-protein kinase PknD [Myxococcota bacterium]